MKKNILLLVFSFIINVNAQIGGGWDWAFNTGALGAPLIHHLKYSTDGSEIFFAGDAFAAAKFGSTTLTATPLIANYPGNIYFLGKINAATGVPTIIRSFDLVSFGYSFNCVTTDEAGNFYVGGPVNSLTPLDFGNGVTLDAYNKVAIVKFSPTGVALWAKPFQLGATGTIGSKVIKLAVSGSDNVHFWGWNGPTEADGKRNTPLIKLDNNGNTVWVKNAYNNLLIGSEQSTFTDKFVDNADNVHLFVNGNFNMDGVNVTGSGATLISFDANGTVTKAQRFAGNVDNFQVNRTTGNLVFRWQQGAANPAPFSSLTLPYANLGPAYAIYANTFYGIVETDKNMNFARNKEYNSGSNTPIKLTDNNDIFLALPNGKLIIHSVFDKDKSYFVGTENGYAADAVNGASVLIETDENWNLSKFITGGKAIRAKQQNIAAYNDTYCMSAQFGFNAVAATAPVVLPSTSYGTVNLTGFNAASDFATAYSLFPNQNFRQDIAIVQTKSQNFPIIATTNWLGNTNNWNTPSNWTNGVPTNAMRALFNASTTNFPTVATTPTAATLQVNAGVNLTLPATVVLLGNVKNDGNVIINNVGVFGGLKAKEWKGNGTVTFSGTAATYAFGNSFTNSLILNTNTNSYTDLNIPTLTLNNAKLNLNNNKLSITDGSATAISGASATSYVYGGTLERKINPTGIYDFPMGNATLAQTATVSSTNLVGTDRLAVKYVNGSLTGTAPNTTIGGVAITSALNGGWFSIDPNQQPTAGNYDVTLKIQGSTNLSPTAWNYVVIKRNNATSQWETAGNYNVATSMGGIITIKNSNLTSFSDFAIGRAVSDLGLANIGFSFKNLKLFPNPANSQINLSFENHLTNARLKIASILGKIVLEKQSVSGNNINLDISNLSAGIYVIEIADDELKFNTKFIKN